MGGFRCLPPTVQRDRDGAGVEETRAGQTVAVCVAMFVRVGMFESKSEVTSSSHRSKTTGKKG